MTIPEQLYTTYSIDQLEEEMIKAERCRDFARVASLREYARWTTLL